MALFLASGMVSCCCVLCQVLMSVIDEASYVNGQAIAVDGGLTASMPVVPGKIA